MSRSYAASSWRTRPRPPSISSPTPGARIHSSAAGHGLPSASPPLARARRRLRPRAPGHTPSARRRTIGPRRHSRPRSSASSPRPPARLTDTSATSRPRCRSVRRYVRRATTSATRPRPQPPRGRPDSSLRAATERRIRRASGCAHWTVDDANRIVVVTARERAAKPERARTVRSASDGDNAERTCHGQHRVEGVRDPPDNSGSNLEVGSSISGAVRATDAT
jgi:hypothetical protein